MTNPVIAPILKSLVFKMDKNLGYYEDKKLKSVNKKAIVVKDDSLLKIAHCFDLLKVEIGLVIKKIYSIEN